MSMFGKLFAASGIGLLAWTLSIHVVPVHPTVSPPPLVICKSDYTTQHVFQSMTDGIVTQIWNDGLVLSVTVSEAWMTLSPGSQETLYRALGCLAQQKNVAFQILPSWQSESS